jgi:O-succinylbenzoic acid--CoA ligase
VVDHWLTRAAAAHPARVAVGETSYHELLARGLAVAGWLRAEGVRRGERVGLAMPPGVDFAAAVHGCFLAGSVAVPIDLRLSEREQARRRLGAVRVLDGSVPNPLGGGPVAEPVPLAGEAVAALMYTSGTTGEPREVPLTYDNWLSSALGSAVALGLSLEERWLCPMPLAHVGGLSILIRSAIYATTVVLHERFDTEAVLATLSDRAQAITLVSLVPTMLARLLDAGLREPPSLRWALLGGGPIPPPLLTRAARAGVPVAPTYGMTEACSQIATNGWPLPGFELRVADDGEILVRGPSVSAAALDEDGWLHTGDLGALADGGRLTICGRKSDTIVTGGENVAPAEVEAILLGHPAVADAGVFSRPDGEWGEAVVAAVVLRPGLDAEADQLRAFCLERLASFKVPKAFAFVSDLPRTESGKLLRRELAGLV